MNNQIFQSSYGQRNNAALLGQLYGSSVGPRGGRVARGLLKAGYGCFQVPTVGASGSQMLDPGECFQIPNPGAGAAVAAIITAITSSTGIQTFNGALLDGLVGGADMQPARFVTLVLSNHADWDLTSATLTGVDSNGLAVSETLSIPNAGNTTLTSANRYLSVTSLVIPAQSGTGGTATVGVSALPALTIADFVGPVIRKNIKTTISTGALFGLPGVVSGSSTADYSDGDIVPLLQTGGIWCFTEEALVDRDPVYVRVASGSGGSVLGAFRNDADSATCVIVPDARVTKSCAAGMAPIYFPHIG